MYIYMYMYTYMYLQFDFGSENVPERDPVVVNEGIEEMKMIIDCLKKESVSDCY